jgi:hypothetical protein
MTTPSLFSFPIFPITIGVLSVVYLIIYGLYKKIGWERTYAIMKYLIIISGILLLLSFFS